MRRLLIAFALVLSPVSLVTASPLINEYWSIELGGSVLDGHWSEAWFNGQQGSVGSVLNAASWDGSALGTMWELTGLTLADVTFMGGNTVGSLTTQEWHTEYSGGTLKLKNSGQWWNPADSGTEYTLTVNSYSQDTIKYFSGSRFISATTNIYLDATFNDHAGYAVDFFIAVAKPLSNGFGATPAGGYPAFAIPTTQGSWGNIQKMTLQIVPEPATVLILGLGSLTALRARKK